MATRYINRRAGTGTMKLHPGATPIQYDEDDDKAKFLDNDGTTVRKVVSEDQTQTLTNKTLTSPTITGAVQTLTVEAVAAAGSSQADATAIAATTGAFIHVTGADATKGAKLPAAAAGRWLVIKNSDAANATLKLYPATGDAINAIAANTEIVMAAKVSMLIVALDATTWYTVPLLPS